MSLVDEIIALAAEDTAPLAGLLRKFLILAHQLKNQRLKDWVSAELNGYDKDAALPSYRSIGAIAKGLFLGGWGAQINDQPLSSSVLKPEHRHFAETVELRQPIAAYFMSPDKNGNPRSAVIEWPANLVVLYQSKFIEHFVLNRAWQEIPQSVIPGLQDTVRTRVLQFALELKDDMGPEENPAELPAAKIEKHVTNIILGGTNVIAAEANDFAQVTHTVVNQNDLQSLKSAFKSIGIADHDFNLLKAALAEDKRALGKPSLGDRSLEWVASLGKTIGKEGLKVASDAAKAAAVAWIKQHVGMP